MSFREHVVIGRGPDSQGPRPGRIDIPDPAISKRHCVITLEADGRVLIRDVSRNGTRLSGRRLQPNVETVLQPGDRITLADAHDFLVEVTPSQAARPSAVDETTHRVTSVLTDVTILVGDLSDYTLLNQTMDPADFYPSVSRVMGGLERLVESWGGAVKEFQGDAIFAYWEAQGDGPQDSAMAACRAALALAEWVASMASDRSVWSVEEFPLRMEWALTSGPVLITSLGIDGPKGIAMVGDAVNFAFALEKLADRENPVLLDEETWRLVRDSFRVEPFGRHRARGRRVAEDIHVLMGEL